MIETHQIDAVHGDIRHLEMTKNGYPSNLWVHGDIRHLETDNCCVHTELSVHGDIRHLENIKN